MLWLTPDAARVLVQGVLRALVLACASMMHAQAAAVPPPVEQETANCAAPVFATDQLVCSDPALRERDRELAALLVSASAPNSPWIEPQRDWFLRRSRCAFVVDHANCVAAAYDERLAIFHSPPLPQARTTARCGTADIVAVNSTDGWIVLFDRQGSVLGVAWNGPPNRDWQPFLLAVSHGRKLTIRSATGDFFACQISRRAASKSSEI